MHAISYSKAGSIFKIEASCWHGLYPVQSEDRISVQLFLKKKLGMGIRIIYLLASERNRGIIFFLLYQF